MKLHIQRHVTIIHLICVAMTLYCCVVFQIDWFSVLTYMVHWEDPSSGVIVFLFPHILHIHHQSSTVENQHCLEQSRPNHMILVENYFLNVFRSVFASVWYQTAKKRESTFSNPESKPKACFSFLWRQCVSVHQDVLYYLSSCWVSFSAKEAFFYYYFFLLFFFFSVSVLELDCSSRLQFSKELFWSYSLAHSSSSSQLLSVCFGRCFGSQALYEFCQTVFPYE